MHLYYHIDNLEFFIKLNTRQYYFHLNACCIPISASHLCLAFPPNAQSQAPEEFRHAYDWGSVRTKYQEIQGSLCNVSPR